MSEFLSHHSDTTRSLVQYCTRLIHGENGRELFDAYRSQIECVESEEVMEVLDYLLQSEIPFEKIKGNVGKIMNVFYKSLDSQNITYPDESHFLRYLMAENRAMETRMQEIKTALKALSLASGIEKPGVLANLLDKVNGLQPYELHYIKKENILFPHIERNFPSFRCLQLMWSFHDDFRRSLKELKRLLSMENPDETAINQEMGRLFFVVLPVIFREEKVVFPVALRYLPDDVWQDMMEQSFETGWCFIPQPSDVASGKLPDKHTSGEGLVNLDTGALLPSEIILMMENLPVDITYIDENDVVRYFSGAKHRIFPRSKAIIGRKVQNCHPPSSVHIVNEIVEAFRSGEREVAEFWIQMRGRFIHIRYFALYDKDRHYKGTIEVSQDVTGIRDLTGERRLLQWQ